MNVQHSFEDNQPCVQTCSDCDDLRGTSSLCRGTNIAFCTSSIIRCVPDRCIAVENLMSLRDMVAP